MNVLFLLMLKNGGIRYFVFFNQFWSKHKLINLVCRCYHVSLMFYLHQVEH